MDNQVTLPIPQYPPFKLRSSLIDKDPVIWVHLLEGYIQLFQLLANDDISLSVKSQQQLQQFLKGFLHETAEESSQIFSLGNINPDIKKNTAALRACVLAVIRAHSIVKLGLTGQSLWNFVEVYVEKNASIVRSLLDGTYKSPLNDNRKSSNISSVPALRAYIETKITEGGFNSSAQQLLFLLLGQHAAPSKAQTFSLSGGVRKGKVLAKDRDRNFASSSSALAFAESFVNAEWIETLEQLYSGGRSIHAEAVKNCMVISILALSVSKLANLVSLLGINSGATMAKCPLLSSIIISDAYKALNPGLEEKLPFLRSLTIVEAEPAVNEKDVEFLIDMFPSLTAAKARVVLQQNDGNAEKVTSMLLDDPMMIETIPDEFTTPKKEPEVSISEKELESGIERFKLHENETTTRVEKKKEALSEEEIKKRTLTAALKMLYDSDDDERDDTYDDQEHDKGSAFQEYEHKPKNKEKARLAVFDQDTSEKEGTPTEGVLSEIEKIELNLFGYYETHGPSVFDKSSRKSKLRDEIKSTTKWTDEQIEGWYRVISDKPGRLKSLESRFRAYFSNRLVAERQQKTKKEESPRPSQPQNSKRNQAHNERQKANRANHNRKRGHNKKTRADLAGMQ